jgi:K+-sensing histidine kinase KdpD
MSAGVGKTYRMLQEAHSLLRNGIDVKIGFIETHNRKETHALLKWITHYPQTNTLLQRERAGRDGFTSSDKPSSRSGNRR